MTPQEKRVWGRWPQWGQGAKPPVLLKKNQGRPGRYALACFARRSGPAAASRPRPAFRGGSSRRPDSMPHLLPKCFSPALIVAMFPLRGPAANHLGWSNDRQAGTRSRAERLAARHAGDDARLDHHLAKRDERRLARHRSAGGVYASGGDLGRHGAYGHLFYPAGTRL